MTRFLGAGDHTKGIRRRGTARASLTASFPPAARRRPARSFIQMRPAAGPAAETVPAHVAAFHQLRPHGAEHASRGLVHAVEPPQVTGVVVGDGRQASRLLNFQLPLPQQLVEQLRVMKDRLVGDSIARVLAARTRPSVRYSFFSVL